MNNSRYLFVLACDTNYEFACSPGTCIGLAKVCDGYPDCPDGRDEVACASPAPVVPCDPRSQFKCEDSPGGECLDIRLVCDGRGDCPRGEDEKNCPTSKKLFA